MASVFSTTATLSCASTNTTRKLSIAKSLSNSRCPNLLGPFIVLDADSAFLAHTLRRLKPYGLATVRLFPQNNPLDDFIQNNQELHEYGSILCTFMQKLLAYHYQSNYDHKSGLNITKTLHRQFRGYAGGDSQNAPESEDGNDGDVGADSEEDMYTLLPDSESQDESIKIEIEKTGKNSRRITSKVAVQASLQSVWHTLTDYERLADFIPGLAVSQLLEKRDNFARLFQIGEQNLALGLKFNAKATIDCFEKDLQTLPFGQKRDIEFKMVEGDFQLFEGKWSVEQETKWNAGDLKSGSAVDREVRTTLLYIVHVKPKVWLPVRLVEGRLCKEIRTNLSCIRDQVEKTFWNTHSAS